MDVIAVDDLRSLMSLRIGRWVQDLDVLSPVAKSVAWLLRKIDGECAGRDNDTALKCASRWEANLRYIAHTASIAGKLWSLERGKRDGSDVPVEFSLVAEYERPGSGVRCLLGVPPAVSRRDLKCAS